jgi:hypothetical protein
MVVRKLAPKKMTRAGFASKVPENSFSFTPGFSPVIEVRKIGETVSTVSSPLAGKFC